MEAIYAMGRATAAEVHERIEDAPSPTAVRTLLRILEEKGHLTHEKDGARPVSRPLVARSSAQRSALRDVLRTFFGGSTTAAVAALLDESERTLSRSERDELIRMIADSREAGE